MEDCHLAGNPGLAAIGNCRKLQSLTLRFCPKFGDKGMIDFSQVRLIFMFLLGLPLIGTQVNYHFGSSNFIHPKTFRTIS